VRAACARWREGTGGRKVGQCEPPHLIRQHRPEIQCCTFSQHCSNRTRRWYIRHTPAGSDLRHPRGLMCWRRRSRPARAMGACVCPGQVVYGGPYVWAVRGEESDSNQYQPQHTSAQMTEQEDSGGSRACENRGCLERRQPAYLPYEATPTDMTATRDRAHSDAHARDAQPEARHSLSWWCEADEASKSG